MNAKHPLRSKTLWLNALVLLLVLVEQNMTALQGVLPANFYVWLLIALPVINMVLRALTTAPLATPVKRKRLPGEVDVDEDSHL